MFKAKLITDQAYYNYRKRSLVFLVLPAIATVLLVNFYELPVWITMLALGAYVVILYFKLKNSNRLKGAAGGGTIEIEDGLLSVKNNNGQSTLEIQLDQADKIEIPHAFGLPLESFKDMAEELAGQPLKNFIIISKGQEEQRYDFIIDSHYMLGQFDKLIKAWILRGYPVETI